MEVRRFEFRFSRSLRSAARQPARSSSQVTCLAPPRRDLYWHSGSMSRPSSWVAKHFGPHLASTSRLSFTDDGKR